MTPELDIVIPVYNEGRNIVAVLAALKRAGFAVSSHYLSGLAYRYVASRCAQLALPLYNVIDSALFGLPVMERLRPFVLTAGAKG